MYREPMFPYMVLFIFKQMYANDFDMSKYICTDILSDDRKSGGGF